jgi:hypothetical protein
MNLPSYDFLSAPLWLINILHIVTLSLHLIAMNFLLGGLVVLMFGKIDGRWMNPSVRNYVKLLPTAAAATITLGVAPLLFAQIVYHRQLYSAAIVSGWFWLLIIPVVILAYYFLYASSFSKRPEITNGRYLTVVLLCLLYVSIVYSSVFSLAENPTLIKDTYTANQSGWTINPDIGSWLIRWLHMVTGAITVGAFFVGWVGRNDDSVFRAGKTFFTWGMAAASVFGLVYLFTLGDYLVPLMKTPAIWALTVGIVLSLGALHMFYKKKFILTAIMLTVSVIMMVYTRHHVRLLHLANQFEPGNLPVQTQWPIFVIFLVLFLTAIGLVGYMLRLFFAGSRTAD